MKMFTRLAILPVMAALWVTVYPHRGETQSQIINNTVQIQPTFSTRNFLEMYQSATPIGTPVAWFDPTGELHVPSCAGCGGSSGGFSNWNTAGAFVLSPGGVGSVSPTGSATVPGTGILAALGDNIGSAGAPVLFNGLGGTPSSINLTNGASMPFTGMSGNASSAQIEPSLAAAVSTLCGASTTEFVRGDGGCDVPSVGSSAFSALTGGTNTAAAMIVGSGATLSATGGGTIAATSVPAAGVGVGALANGMTATTQSPGNNTTDVATTAFVQANGGSTTITLGPGLAATPGTYNAGAQTVTNGSTVSPQLFYQAESTSCTLNSTCKSGSTNDSGLLPTFTAAGQTLTLPAPSAVGVATYQSGYDGSHSYSVTTPSGVVNGACGSGAAAATVNGLFFQASYVSDGTNWQCSPNGSQAYQAADITATASLDPTTTPALCNGGTLAYNSSSAGTLTILNTYPASCNFLLKVKGTGLPTVSAGSGTVHTACPTGSGVAATARARYSGLWISGDATGVVEVGGDCS